MSDINLTDYLKQKYAPYPRVAGRYNSSELYRISKGYLKPEEWGQPKRFPINVLLAMWNGELVHEYIQNLLVEGQREVKKIYLHNEPSFELVAKADWLPEEDAVWEFKTSGKMMTSAKPEHLYQVKLYCSIFEKSKGIVFQPHQDANGLYLKNIGEVERDDTWFLEQMKMLGEFHTKVEQLKDNNTVPF